MKTNVELEFINEVKKLSEQMRKLSNFWHDNQETLEDLNVSKDYPFSINFEELTFDTYNWLLTLINNYCENDPNNLYAIFNEYLKNLQK